MEQKRKLKNLQEKQNEIETDQEEEEREQPLQYGLCKIEGEANRIRNGSTDTRLCIECNSHLIYNKNKICKYCYLNGLEWRVTEGEIQPLPVVHGKKENYYIKSEEVDLRKY